MLGVLFILTSCVNATPPPNQTIYCINSKTNQTIKFNTNDIETVYTKNGNITKVVFKDSTISMSELNDMDCYKKKPTPTVDDENVIYMYASI
jgi:hypothetical protein